MTPSYTKNGFCKEKTYRTLDTKQKKHSLKYTAKHLQDT
jgi:hypothetical protein